MLRSGPRLSLGSLSPDTELIGASCCHFGDMIAPTAHGCKRAVAGAFELVRDGGSQPLIKREIYRHGIVSRIIILPNFRLSAAVLDCEKEILRWPGPFGSGFLSPQPPGVVRIGPVRKKHTPILGQRELVLFCLCRDVSASTNFSPSISANSLPSS